MRIRCPRRCGSSCAVLAVVLVVAAGGGRLAGREGQARGRRPDGTCARRPAVASQFALRMDNVDGTDFDSYIKGVNELLTTKAKTKNQQTFAVLKQSYAGRQGQGHRQGRC